MSDVGPGYLNSVLDTWDSRAIDTATATVDFPFRDIRCQPHAIYLVVEAEMIRPLAPLFRLFFSDLITSLQAREPGEDEPWPVIILAHMAVDDGGSSLEGFVRPLDLFRNRNGSSRIPRFLRGRA